MFTPLILLLLQIVGYIFTGVLCYKLLEKYTNKEEDFIISGSSILFSCLWPFTLVMFLILAPIIITISLSAKLIKFLSFGKL
jgi:hypothetical protein